MIHIELENGNRIPLRRKSLLIVPAGSQTTHIINNEDDYNLIVIASGADRTIDIELRVPAIIVLDGCIKTTVNVTGGMALPISQAVLIAGHDNVVNGLANQNPGAIRSPHYEASFFDAISIFDKIDLKK